MHRRPLIGTLACVLTAVVLGSCAGGGPGAESSITVHAASSLTRAFTDIGREFGRLNPGVDVTFNFAGSSELAAQIEAGAPADVFAAADASTMDRVLRGRSGISPVTFASNSMQIIVATGNPRGISGLGDLARPDVSTVLCDPAVPCGRYARMILDAAGIGSIARSLESNVTAVVSKVVLGEADAGVVYVTDVVATAGAAEGVEIATGENVTVNLQIAALTPGGTARSFVAFVLSEAGREILVRHGFRDAG